MSDRMQKVLIQTAGGGREDRSRRLEFFNQQIQLLDRIGAAVLHNEGIRQNRALAGVDQSFGHGPELPRVHVEAEERIDLLLFTVFDIAVDVFHDV